MWRRLIQALLISLVFGLLGLGLVFWLGKIKLEQLGVIRQLSPLYLVCAILALLLSFVLSGLRMQHLARRLQHHLALRHAVRAHILSNFSATVTPGGSGATPAIAFMLQYQGLTSGQAWATGIAIFVSDAIFHVWSLPLAIIFLRWHGLYPKGLAWAVAGILAIVATALLAYVLLFHLRWLTPIFRWLLRGVLLRFRKNALRFVDSLLESNHYFTGASWGFYALTQLYTFLAWFSFFSVLTFLAKGLELHISPVASAAWQIATTTVSYFVPTPGGSGFFELGTSLLLLGQGNDNAVPAVLLVWRVVTFYLFFLLGPIFGGYILLKQIQKNP